MSRDGQSGWTRIALPIVVVGVVALALWLFRGRIQEAGRVEDQDITVICASCGHSFGSSIEGMAELVTAAQAKGFKQVGSGISAPVAVCPACGKPSVYRASRCPQCGKPVLFTTAEVDGKRVKPECRACGWKSAGQASPPGTGR